MAVDASGNVFVADSSNSRIRMIDGTTGVISTVAGTGGFGFNGDGIPAVDATLGGSQGLALDATGNLYLADTSNQRIRKVVGVAAAVPTPTPTPVPGLTTWGLAGMAGIMFALVLWHSRRTFKTG